MQISSAVPCHATQGRNSFVSLSFTFSLHATRKLHTVVPFCVALRSGSEQSRPCKIILFTIFFLLTNNFFQILFLSFQLVLLLFLNLFLTYIPLYLALVLDLYLLQILLLHFYHMLSYQMLYLLLFFLL